MAMALPLKYIPDGRSICWRKKTRRCKAYHKKLELTIADSTDALDEVRWGKSTFLEDSERFWRIFVLLLRSFSLGKSQFVTGGRHVQDYL